MLVMHHCIWVSTFLKEVLHKIIRVNNRDRDHADKKMTHAGTPSHNPCVTDLLKLGVPGAHGCSSGASMSTTTERRLLPEPPLRPGAGSPAACDAAGGAPGASAGCGGVRNAWQAASAGAVPSSLHCCTGRGGPACSRRICGPTTARAVECSACHGPHSFHAACGVASGQASKQESSPVLCREPAARASPPSMCHIPAKQ